MCELTPFQKIRIVVISDEDFDDDETMEIVWDTIVSDMLDGREIKEVCDCLSRHRPQLLVKMKDKGLF